MGIPSSFVPDALRAVHEAGLYRVPRIVEAVRGPYVTVEGRELLCFCSNDYLGLAQRPEPGEAARKAAEEFGWGGGSSRLVAGTTPCHVELEREIARFKKTEAALFFPSGYMANLALLTVLADRDTVILSDALNHASVIDGCRLSRARVEVYEHAAVDAVIGLLRRHQDVKRRLVVTDAVFSMDGDLAPLRELTGLASYHGAEVVVDDTHGTGVLGAHGRGTLEHFDLEGAVRFQSGNFGKAFGSAGGFVAGPADFIDYCRNRARPFIFTTAPPPALAAANLASLKLVEKADAERRRLAANTDHLRAGLRGAGFDVGESESPILPVVLGDVDRTMAASQTLWDAGFFVPGIRPPSVPEGRSRLRISVSALHERDHLDALLAALGKIER